MEHATSKAGGFEPVHVTPDDLEDLAGFTGMSPQACLERLRNYSPSELAEQWRRAAPRNEQELLEFYRSADLYVWDLVQWHSSRDRRKHWQAFVDVANRFPPEAGYGRVYEFGAGIGTDALYLAERGYDVTLVDVDGPALRFAQYRFQRRGLSARFVVSTSSVPEPDGTYDMVVCFDVFEHLPDPLLAARRLVAALRPGGLLVQGADFSHDHDHPQHLDEGTRRFEGPRWHIHLTGLGLEQESHLAYRRVTGLRGLVLAARFQLWRATGLWVTTVERTAAQAHL